MKPTLWGFIYIVLSGTLLFNAIAYYESNPLISAMLCFAAQLSLVNAVRENLRK